MAFDLPGLSIGVELEVVLFFTEALLAAHLEPGHTIDKNVVNNQGIQYSRKRFPGWGLDMSNGKREDFLPYDLEGPKICISLIKDAAEDESDKSSGSASMDFGDSDNDANSGAPQLVATIASGTNSAESANSEAENASHTPKINKSKKPFSTALPWGVIVDHSIIGLTAEEKAERNYDPDQWDTTGVEFVSKVYGENRTGSGIEALQQDVHTLKAALTTAQSAIATTDTTGFHIHVGQPNNARFPIEVLRALKFILLIFENEISKVHASRRIDQDLGWSQIRPNLVCWRIEEFDRCERDLKTVHDEHSGLTKYYRSKYISIAEIRDYIFRSEFEDDDAAYKYLKELSWEKTKGIDTRRHIVNWDNIDGINHKYSWRSGNYFGEPDIDATYHRPPTIEFRQPEGTLDPDTIGHLVHFYLAIVRYAYTLAHQGRDALRQIDTWASELIDIEHLLGNLELPNDTREFLQLRLEAREMEMMKAFCKDEWMGNDVWEECDEDGHTPDDDDVFMDDGY